MKYVRNINTGQVFVANPTLEARKDMEPVDLVFEAENILEQADLAQMKKEELLEKAESMGIKIPAGTNKADIIDMIKAQEG